MVEKYTLDTNCIIDLEEYRSGAKHIEKMLKAHKNNEIDLAVVAISASENQKNGKYNQNFEEFEKKLENIELDHLQMLLPMAYWDVAFWDHAVWDGNPVLELSIHNILFNGTPIEKPQEHGFPFKKWRRNKCDVQVAWAHVHYGRDVLVTSDKNFHKHAKELSKIGIKKIIRPEEFKP